VAYGGVVTDGFEIDDTRPRRSDEIAAVIAVIAVIGIAFAFERAFRRWSKEVSPLAVPRARVEHMRTGYQKKREVMGDLAQIVDAVLGGARSARGEG
jgi:hypothetical protein